MTILVLVRNFVPAHEQIQAGEWDVAAAAKNEFDLEGKVVGTVAVGRIGERVLRRLKPFDCKELLYFDYQPLKPEIEKEIGCRRVENLEEMLAQCDVVTINCPLHEKTRGLFNKELISKMKPGISNLLFLNNHILTYCRIMARQHCPWCHRCQGGRRRCSQVRPPPRLRRRRLVPSASTKGPPTQIRKEPIRWRKRNGSSHVRYLPRCPEEIRRWHQGYLGELSERKARLQTTGFDCSWW